jgi:hypothetical protein
MTQEQGKLNGVNYVFLSEIECNLEGKLGWRPYEDAAEMISEDCTAACYDGSLS